MNCRKARQWMAQEREGLEAHLQVCSPCREWWTRWREAERALASVRELDPEPPADLAERIKASVARETLPQQALAAMRDTEVPVPPDLAPRIKQAVAAHHQPQQTPRLIGVPAVVGAVAAVLIVALSVYTIGGRSGATVPTSTAPPAPAPTVRSAMAPAQPATPAASPTQAPEGSRPGPAASGSRPAVPPVRLASAGPGMGKRVAVARRAVEARRRAPEHVRTGTGMDSDRDIHPVALHTVHENVPGDGTGNAEAPTQPAAKPVTDTDRGLVAGVVASFVVERYVAEHIIQSEPTLLAVTTAVPTAPDTALSGLPAREEP